MTIIGIKENYVSNILTWAIANGADIKDDPPLVELINRELHYLVTIVDVNLFELFRLTQRYRDKLRIVNEKQAEIPTNASLHESFPGDHPRKDDNGNIECWEIARDCIVKFMNLVSQMQTDDDIIHPGAVRLFIPMICRKYSVQIPVDFVDLVEALSPDEAAKLFTREYPSTLQAIVDGTPISDSTTDRIMHNAIRILSMAFVKATEPLRYNDRYISYLKTIKYSPLKKYQGNKLYKFGLLGFSKKDTISRSELNCTLFKPNPVNMMTALKRLGKLNSPLEFEFVVQMPIQYMQLLENSFGQDVLSISCESPMKTIIEGDLIYDDFKTPEYAGEDNESEIEKHTNSIEAYRVRITECNVTMLVYYPILFTKDGVDESAGFALLPSLYKSIAVIKFNSENIQKFIGHNDPLISEMFQEMSEVMESVNEDIRKVK